MMYIELLKETLLQGLLFSLVVMGVYFTSRVVKCDDLSVEGSFGFSGAASAWWVMTYGSVWEAIGIGLLAGSSVGLVTGLLHTKLKLHYLIAGIVTTTAVYSLNLKVAGANLSLAAYTTVFDYARSLGSMGDLILLLIVSVAAYTALKYLLSTEVGLILRASGCNPGLLASLGRNVALYKNLGFTLSGACIGLAGSLFVQLTAFFSISGSLGVLVIGLTGLILAQMKSTTFSVMLIGGALLCQVVFTCAIALGLDPVWNYLIKASLIVLFLQMRAMQSQLVGISC